jgi:predicted Zn finger-like uncharacterized protein
MTVILTQCPHCQTSFRVSTIQLNAAKGLVRCGSCLGVFSAAANEIRIKHPDGYVVEELEPLDEQDAPAQSSADDADLAAVSISPIATTSFETATEAELEADFETATEADFETETDFETEFEPESESDRESNDNETEQDATHDYRNDDDDISLGDMQLDELVYSEDSALEPPAPTVKVATVHTDASVVDQHDADPAGYDQADYDQAEYDQADYDEGEDPADSTDESEQDYAPPAKQHSSFRPTSNSHPSRDKRALHEYLSALTDDEALAPVADSHLNILDEVPVTLTSGTRFRSQLAHSTLLLLNLALLLALPLPWLYTERDALSTHPRFSFLAPTVCRLFTCAAPIIAPVTSLYSQQLLVRSHPRFENTLEVSFVFHNDSAQAQPFPSLELAFSDLNNQLMSNRLFAPAEYLPPELRQLSAMPASSSVQVALELADPGKTAVNYTVKLHTR